MTDENPRCIYRSPYTFFENHLTLLFLSTWWWRTAPNFVHSSLTSSPISMSQSGSVSLQVGEWSTSGMEKNRRLAGKTYVAGSNMFFRRTQGVGMGDLGPKQPCSSARGFMEACGRGGGPGRIGAPRGILLAPEPMPGKEEAPDRRCIKAARDCAESFRPPPAVQAINSTSNIQLPKQKDRRAWIETWDERRQSVSACWRRQKLQGCKDVSSCTLPSPLSFSSHQ